MKYPVSRRRLISCWDRVLAALERARCLLGESAAPADDELEEEDWRDCDGLAGELIDWRELELECVEDVGDAGLAEKPALFCGWGALSVLASSGTRVSWLDTTTTVDGVSAAAGAHSTARGGIGSNGRVYPAGFLENMPCGRSLAKLGALVVVTCLLFVAGVFCQRKILSKLLLLAAHLSGRKATLTRTRYASQPTGRRSPHEARSPASAASRT
jgi:hypothetical protein